MFPISLSRPLRSVADPLTPEARSLLMGRVRQQGTGIELVLRRALWASGLRYRLKTKPRLPGRPDIVFPGARVAVFIDGCFWHGCPWHGTRPKTRSEFWASKIARNRERDSEVDARLSAMGWTVIRFWEHDIRDGLSKCVADVVTVVGGRARRAHTENVITNNRSKAKLSE